ncbi:MAG: hypothetical protein AAGI30_01230 [Planctomycetota bacterium]
MPTLAIEDFIGGQVIFIGLIVALMIGGAIAAWWFDRKRLDALRAWAASNGLTFDPHKRSYALPISLFRKGHSRWARRFCTGRLEQPIAGLDDHPPLELFEYHYAVTSGSGKNRRTTHYYHPCIAVHLAFEPGDLAIRDEHLGDKLGAAFGMDDIDFEHAEFSKRYHVTGHDRERVYELMHTRMIDFLLTYRRQRLEIAGDTLFVHLTGRADVEDYDRLLGCCRGILALLPRTLVNRERVRRGLDVIIDAGAAAAKPEV